MTDLNCLLAGLARLLCPLILLIFWHKRTGARILPAPAAYAVCIPVFIIGGAIRNGFSHSDFYAYYIQQGVLYGILEEGSKFLMLRYALTSYDNRRDAVTYGIGHGAFEEFGAGLSCFGLIGTDRAAPEIFFVNLWGAVQGSLSVIALTVLIFYGISTEKSKITLPVAIFLHAFSSFVMGIFMFSTPIVTIADTLITAGECYIAYRCWREMQPPFEFG